MRATHNVVGARRSRDCHVLILAPLLGSLLSGPIMAESGPAKPNIVIILTDDLGYGDVGFHGCQDIPTPNLDRLAAEGVRCTNGYVSHPFCNPTRAGLITGRYQQRFGHENNPRFDPKDDIAGLPTRSTPWPKCWLGPAT